MFGRARGTSAQLALMDALMFFTAAMVISAVLSGYVGRGPAAAGPVAGSSDAEDILRVFLRASLGTKVTIGWPHEVILSGAESVGECLASEASALCAGCPSAAFGELNACLLSAAKNLTGPRFCPYILVFESERNSTSPCIALPEVPTADKNLLAGSALLPAIDGLEFVVVLVLYPAASLELVPV